MESRTPRRVRYGACITLFVVSRAVRVCGLGRHPDDTAYGCVGFFPHRATRHQFGNGGSKRDAFCIERCFFRLGFGVLHRA